MDGGCVDGADRGQPGGGRAKNRITVDGGGGIRDRYLFSARTPRCAWKR